MGTLLNLLQLHGYTSIENLQEYLFTQEEKETFENFIKNDDEAGLIKWIKEN